MKKLLSAALCLICLFSFCLTGLAETAEADYLSQIPGTYVELFPELSKEETMTTGWPPLRPWLAKRTPKLP